MPATVVIVGGAIIGTMTAFWLRELGHGGPILVIERDPTYRLSSTALSAASIRTQFGCAVNVRQSLFGAEFLKNLGAEIGFRESGYLILGHADRTDLVARQNALGASVAAWSPAETAARFPWLHAGDIAGATFGLRDEGWFDAWALLQLMRRAAKLRGVDYLAAEATGFVMQGGRIAAVETAGAERIAGDWFVDAAGPASGRVAGWAGIALPVAPRKRTVFHVKAPLDGTGMPMLFDLSGAWIRPEGDGFICGIAPPHDADPDAWDDFTPDHHLFEDVLWPILAQRIPALEELRLVSSWAGHYDMNLVDHNAVIGRVAGVDNLLLAAGFSGHGVMHAPAAGRGVAELICHDGYRSLDLSPLAHGRPPLLETAVY